MHMSGTHSKGCRCSRKIVAAGHLVVLHVGSVIKIDLVLLASAKHAIHLLLETVYLQVYRRQASSTNGVLMCKCPAVDAKVHTGAGRNADSLASEAVGHSACSSNLSVDAPLPQS